MELERGCLSGLNPDTETEIASTTSLSGQLGKALCLAGVLLINTLACSGGDVAVSIVAPTDDSIHSDLPQSFDVTYSAAVPETMVYTLNGIDVTDSFSVNGQVASAAGADLSEFILPGDNLFKVTGAKFASPVIFHYDALGPKVLIDSTDLVGSIQTVTGRVVDVSTVSSVIIDGQSQPIDSPIQNEQSFSYSFDPLTLTDNILSITGEDALGHINSTNFLLKDGVIIGAVAAKMKQGGVDGGTEFLEGQLQNISVDAGLNIRYPLIDDPVYWVDFTPTSFSYSGLTIDVQIGETHIDVATGNVVPNAANDGSTSTHPSMVITGQVPEAVVNGTLYYGKAQTCGWIGPFWTCTAANGSIALGNMRAQLNLSTTVIFNDHSSGDSEFGLNFVDTSITSNTVTFDNFPSVITNAAGVKVNIQQALVDEILGDFSTQMETVLVTQIQNITNLNSLGYQVTTSLDPVVYNAADTSLTMFTSNNVAPILEEGQVTYEDTLIGSRLSVERGLPEAYESPNYDFGGAMSVDLANRIAMAAYMAGDMHLTTVTPLFKMTIAPSQVPYLQFSPFQDGFRSEFILDEMHLIVRNPTTDALLFDVLLDVRAPLDVSYTGDNKLHLTMQNTPTFNVLNADNFFEELVYTGISAGLVTSLQEMANNMGDIPIAPKELAHDNYVVMATELTTIESATSSISSHAFLGGSIVRNYNDGFNDTVVSDESVASCLLDAAINQGWSVGDEVPSQGVIDSVNAKLESIFQEGFATAIDTSLATVDPLSSDWFNDARNALNLLQVDLSPYIGTPLAFHAANPNLQITINSIGAESVSFTSEVKTSIVPVTPSIEFVLTTGGAEVLTFDFTITDTSTGTTYAPQQATAKRVTGIGKTYAVDDVSASADLWPVRWIDIANFTDPGCL